MDIAQIDIEKRMCCGVDPAWNLHAAIDQTAALIGSLYKKTASTVDLTEDVLTV